MVTKATEKKKTAEQPLITQDQKIERPEPFEIITVVAGNEHYAPIPFFSFDVGPLTMVTPVRETESYEDAIDRCQTVLGEAMQNQFIQKMEQFFDRVGQLDAYMVERGMATRTQQEAVSRTSSKPQADMTKPPVQPTPKEPPTTSNMLGFTGNPQANGNAELPSAGQNNLFGKLQKDRGVDGRALSMEIFGVEPHNLHRAAMSKLLDYINDNYKQQPTQDHPGAGPGSSGTSSEYKSDDPTDYPF